MSGPCPSVEQRGGLRVVRIGRRPDPLAFVPMSAQTWAGRFDDPDRLSRTLYTAMDEYGAWVEVLGRFRAHLPTGTSLDAIAGEGGDREPVLPGTVSLTWIASRAVGHAQVLARVVELGSDVTLRWLDLRPPIREILASRHIADVDLSAVTGPDRSLTQAVARELRLWGQADALLYPSRYGAPTTCVALFEPREGLPRIEPITEPVRVDPIGDSLEDAMALHGLRWAV